MVVVNLSQEAMGAEVGLGLNAKEFLGRVRVVRAGFFRGGVI